MMLQNNCINNSVTNGLKHKKEKKSNMQNSFIWLIVAHPQKKTCLSTVTTQHNIKQRYVRRLLMRLSARKAPINHA